MSENKNIEYISIEKLHPHDKNPRGDVGDVTELAESIKANGVLQNLTVVPATGYWHGDYTVIIGHRRLAAAKTAGLTELPCAIVEMSPQEQIATMLLENMQRCDLTVYEQAQGFQMMLDLGETVETVAEKTGFSQSTIRRRTKLLQFDAGTFKATESRDITLQDYEKLFDIKDAERRDKVLEQIGTNNFNNALQSAKNEEQRETKRAGLKAALDAVATELDKDANTDDYKYVTWADNEEKARESCGGDYKYFYKFYTYANFAYIYREYTDEEIRERDAEETEREEKRARDAERQRRVSEINERMFTLRRNFIRECSLKGKTAVVMEYAARTFMGMSRGKSLDAYLAGGALDLKLYGATNNDEMWDAIAPKFAVEPERVLLALAYGFSGDGKNKGYLNGCGDTLDEIYDMLERLGYETSDEEKALRDGTHEMYVEAAR